MDRQSKICHIRHDGSVAPLARCQSPGSSRPRCCQHYRTLSQHDHHLQWHGPASTKSVSDGGLMQQYGARRNGRHVGGWADTSSVSTATRLIDRPFSTSPLNLAPHHVCASIVCFPGYRKSLEESAFPKETRKPDGALVPIKVQWLANPFPAVPG